MAAAAAEEVVVVEVTKTTTMVPEAVGPAVPDSRLSQARRRRGRDIVQILPAAAVTTIIDGGRTVGSVWSPYPALGRTRCPSAPRTTNEKMTSSSRITKTTNYFLTPFSKNIAENYPG